MKALPMWKILRPIILPASSLLVSRLKTCGCNIGQCGYGILWNKTFNAIHMRQEASLVMLSLADIGFSRRTAISYIYERVEALGLILCQPAIGPQLRLQYLDQPRGECLYIGMQRIYNTDGDHILFSVSADNSGKLWLDGTDGDLGSNLWSPSSRWVFVQARQ